MKAGVLSRHIGTGLIVADVVALDQREAVLYWKHYIMIGYTIRPGDETQQYFEYWITPQE